MRDFHAIKNRQRTAISLFSAILADKIDSHRGPEPAVKNRQRMAMRDFGALRPNN